MDPEYFEVLVEEKETILDAIIDVLLGGTSDKLKLVKKCLLDEGRISDILLWNNLSLFLKEGKFDISKLHRLSEMFEEYGNKKTMALTLVKAIDDIDSELKARCLSNLTQSVINSEIDINKYFRLMHATKWLVKEDFEYISRNISGVTLVGDEHLDDYLTAGIMREVDGGYVYTERAWDLCQYGILRGHTVDRPMEIKQRSIVLLGDPDYGDDDVE